MATAVNGSVHHIAKCRVHRRFFRPPKRMHIHVNTALAGNDKIFCLPTRRERQFRGPGNAMTTSSTYIYALLAGAP